MQNKKINFILNMSDFYVYVSSQNLPNNYISKSVAVNTLPSQINVVEKQWEVAVLKTSLTETWNNLTNVRFSLTKYDGKKIRVLNIFLEPQKH